MVQNIPNSVFNTARSYMTQEQFCFWLQGLFELCPDLKTLTETQVKMIRDHLNYVFEGKPSTYQSSVQVTPIYTTAPYYPGASTGILSMGSISDSSGNILDLPYVC